MSKSLLFIILCSILSIILAQNQPTENKPIEKNWYELQMMPDPVTNDVLLFYMGSTWYGGADIGECLDTANRIDLANEYSWANEWRATAQRLQTLAETSEKTGHQRSAGKAYLRASTYYRAALHHHPDPNASDVIEMTKEAVTCFQKSMDLLNIPVQFVQIPYENTTLPGYLFHSPIAKEKAPILIVHQGRDAWAEDCFYLAQESMARGYHCLLFNGPGQGSTLRLQNLPFRYDWEKVISPVVNFVVADEKVDSQRMALMGISMGGFLVTRAVAFENRLKICIANPGAINWYATIAGYLDTIIPGLTNLVTEDPDTFTKKLDELTKVSELLRWGIRDTMWKHGVSSPVEMMLELKKYDNTAIVKQIKCKMLIMDGEAEMFEIGQAKKLYTALECEKNYILFTKNDTGLLHCQSGALGISTHRLFDWLEDNF